MQLILQSEGVRLECIEEHVILAIGAIYEASSVHSKGVSYEKKTVEEVTGLVCHCKTVLEGMHIKYVPRVKSLAP